LILVPCLYLIVEDARQKLQHLRSAAVAQMGAK
jgi:hypothetical protein